MSGDDDAPAWGPARRVLAAEVAEQVLLHGRSRIAVGTELGLSRFQVARLLDAARERGLVRVAIDPGGDVDAARSAAVRAAYGLRRALVARDDDTHPDGGGVPALAAALLAETVGTGDVLGLAWSRTVNDVVGLLPRLARCTVVQLCGAYSLPWRRDGSATAVFRAAALCGGDAYPVYAPLLLPDADTARAVRAQPGVADALARCAALDTAVVGIGAWRAGHSTVHDVLTAPERRRLAEGGAVGEVVGLLVDRTGRVLDSGPAHQLVAAGEADLRAAGDVIALVRDPERADATRAVLRSGLVHTLVCDAATADALRVAGDGRHPPTATTS
ncbi:sugar-binding transcriptional regulator [Pseudonocardia sp. ICBG601]|uniref:sugar-binding transcriptional regulator n=1 Tax=Pseudonocardia sp. ICBG601 TaxID=2846759 RepID=UPI001CF68F8C|nr:sugar-binding domain-containing protein [Pseudonocardia sp. ICBG601]